MLRACRNRILAASRASESWETWWIHLGSSGRAGGPVHHRHCVISGETQVGCVCCRFLARLAPVSAVWMTLGERNHRGGDSQPHRRAERRRFGQTALSVPSPPAFVDVVVPRHACGIVASRGPVVELWVELWQAQEMDWMCRSPCGDGQPTERYVVRASIVCREAQFSCRLLMGQHRQRHDMWGMKRAMLRV